MKSVFEYFFLASFIKISGLLCKNFVTVYYFSSYKSIPNYRREKDTEF